MSSWRWSTRKQPLTSCRRAAQRLAGELQQRFALFADYFRPDSSETWISITDEYFTDYR
jgi:hypothetical protein